MNKVIFLLWLTCCIGGSLRAQQTLFSYGPYKVDKSEFLWAYNMNNVHGKAENGHPLKTYLDLYTNYKLKVRDARDAHMDTAQDFLRDQRGFRDQLAAQTMRRLEGISALSREALLRGQTDIEIAQIFVGFTNPGDTLDAYNRIKAALAQLNSGIAFETVAGAYGTNPTLKTTGGYTGFITVFSLPYAAERMVYSLRDGAFSGIYRSHSGYHIFRRISQRPNPGQLRVAQILLAYPPKATQAEKDQVFLKAGLVYDSLMKGGNFDSLVRRYSDDKMTYYNYGQLPEFTTGDFDAAFEKAAFALPENGAVSRPVETSYGFHLIKRIGLQPALKDSLDSQPWYALQQKVFYSDRMDAAKDAFAESILPQLHYRSFHYDTAWMFRLADTLLKQHGGDDFIKHKKVFPLFSLDNTTYTSADWMRYLLYRRTGDTHDPLIGYPEWLRAFLHISTLEYFQSNLDRYNTDYHYQVMEFAEGTLLFSITQQQVWIKAATDSAGLRNWFDGHRERFYLRPAADVVSFTATDSATLSAFRERLEQNAARWRTVLGDYQGVVADSAHVDLGALSSDSAGATPGLITRVRFQPDNHWHAYEIVRTYPSRSALSFEEVKGLVLADYQTHLEQKWLSALRKKYPVIIHQSTLAQIQP